MPVYLFYHIKCAEKMHVTKYNVNILTSYPSGLVGVRNEHKYWRSTDHEKAWVVGENSYALL